MHLEQAASHTAFEGELCTSEARAEAHVLLRLQCLVTFSGAICYTLTTQNASGSFMQW